jgi:hypothetical protein
MPVGLSSSPVASLFFQPCFDRRLPSLQSSVTWFRVEQGSPAAAAAAAGGVGGAAAGGVAAAAGRLTFASNKDAVDQVSVICWFVITKLLGVG